MSRPPTMSTAVAMLRTVTGDVRLVVVPSPSCPNELNPQARIVPLSSKASEW